MTRRTNYKVVEGTKENPKRIVVKVGSHNGKYGRVSLPPALIGVVVEVIVPDVPLADAAVGNGEPPESIQRKKDAVPIEQSMTQSAEAVGVEKSSGEVAEAVEGDEKAVE